MPKLSVFLSYTQNALIEKLYNFDEFNI